MRVNLLMPVYHGAARLPKTMTSLFTQSYSKFRLIAVDDGSTDNTLEILRTYATKDSRVRVIPSARNQGIVAALNLGLAHLDEDCEYLARVDCGDTCDPSRLQKQVEFLDHHPEAGLVGTEFAMFCETGSLPEGILRFQNFSNRLHHHAEILSNFTVMSPFAHPTLMFRSKIFRETGLYAKEYPAAEDYEIVGRVLNRGYQVEKIPEVLLRCEFTPNQGISQTQRIQQVKAALQIKLAFIDHHFLSVREQNFYIWGIRDFAGYLEEELQGGEYQAGVKAFTDFDETAWGQTKNGIPIISPTEMVHDMEAEDRVITMWNIDREAIMAFLDQHGLQRNRRYFVFS